MTRDTSSEEDYYVGLCWSKPWILKRKDFKQVEHFLYACTLSEFVVAEGRADKNGDAEHLEGAERIAALKKHGKCVFGARLRECKEEVLTFEWEDKQGFSFKCGDDIVLSRKDPDVDGWKHMGKVLSKSEIGCRISLSNFPPDIHSESWRLDVHHSDYTVSQQLTAINDIASQHGNALTDVLINAVGTDAAARNRCCHELPEFEAVVKACVLKHALNEEQSEVLYTSLRHHVFLVQGPPGTGKS